MVAETDSEQETAAKIPAARVVLDAILNDIRDFQAREVNRMGFVPRTLKFDQDAYGMGPIRVVRGAKPCPLPDGERP